MMRLTGILLIGIIFLASVSSATAQGSFFVRAASVDNIEGNENFERFWNILDKVSSLVVEVNSSPSYENVHSLIKWARLGEENAGNISAFTWKALLNLRNSGAKLRYTSDEIKSMASNISRNGLPSKTIRVLRESGWSDDQINAFVSYINEHSDEIVGDFDLGAYLEAFSDSFLEVGRRYSGYETWAIEKYYWRNALSNPPSGSVVSNPYVSSYDVNKLDYAASTKNADGLLLTVKSLRDDLEFVIMDAATAYYVNGGVKFQTTSISSSGKTIRTYYWPNALKAYRLVSELYTISVALENGNSNEDLWDIVRQYRKELTSILDVQLVSTTFIPAPRPGPSPTPIPLELSSFSPALYTSGNEPRLAITDIKIIKTDVDFIEGIVKYRVQVNYYVYGGAVMIDWVKFNDGSESRSMTLGTIAYTGPGSIESPEFIAPFGNSLWAFVSGIVKIRYRLVTSPGGNIPNVKPGDPVKSASLLGYPSTDYFSSVAPSLVMETYQGALNLISDVDPSKLTIDAIANVTTITEGQRIAFSLQIRNDNTKAVRGIYSFFAVIPEGGSKRLVLLAKDKINLGPGSFLIVPIGNVTYLRAGTYEYFATFSFAGMEKKDSGSIEVARLVLQKNLVIEGVQTSLADPEELDDMDIVVYLHNFYTLVPESSLGSSVLRDNFGPDAIVPSSAEGQDNLRLSVVIRDVKTSSLVFGKSIQLNSLNIMPFYVFHWESIPAGDFELIVSLIRGIEDVIDKKTTSLHVREGDGYTGRLLVGESPIGNITVVQGTFLNITVEADYYGELKNEYVPLRVWYLYEPPTGINSQTTSIIVFERNIKFSNAPEILRGDKYVYQFKNWFGLHFNNPGRYYLYLGVNGEFENEKTITVTSNDSVMAWMECTPGFISEETDSVMCSVNMKNQDNTPVDVWITDIYFARGKIYDSSAYDNLVVPNPEGLTLNPDSLGTFTFAIPINDDLQDRVPVNLEDINLRTPIAIKVYLNHQKDPLMYVVEMNPRPLTAEDIAETIYSGATLAKDKVIGVFADIKTAISLIGGPKLVRLGIIYLAKEFGIEVSAGTLGTVIAAGLLYLMFCIKVLESPIPENTLGDNNLIVGD
jgi:hypothetical protein